MPDPQTPDVDAPRDPTPAHGRPFVPEGFTPPRPPRHQRFRLEPLGPQHNDSDYAAWTSSMDHIRATPGFEGRSWPQPMTPEENLDDLVMHADHFERRLGFTYTVLAPTGDVVGCVYIYPSDDPGVDAQVRSWVRADQADLDTVLASVVSEWLAGPSWPFGRVDYPGRPEASSG